MPIYEYLCEKEAGGCGHKFEEIQGFKDGPLTECPQCKKESLKKLLGIPNFQFKGEGWTETKNTTIGKWKDLKDTVDEKNQKKH